MQLRVFLSILSAILIGGCVLTPEPYRETAVYDLTGAKAAKLPAFKVRFEGFNNLTPANRKMLFRQADGRLQESPYTVWAQSPELMLRRYLNEYFASDYMENSTARCEVGGTIYQFDLDSRAKVLRLGVNYEINLRRADAKSAFSGSFSTEAPLETADGAGAAAALSKCAAKLAAELETKLLSLK